MPLPNSDEVLPGGFVTTVVRVGDTVRRQLPEHAEYVAELLTYLAGQGWSGSPRFLGVDDQGRQVLSFVDGHVPWQEPIRSAESLIGVARLTRELHDLTAGTPLAAGGEVACHNDLSPKNTVYRGQQPVAFIDWDIAGPGQRVHDLAHVCWQFVDLGPSIVDLAAAGEQVRLIAETYGLDDRSTLVPAILWWQDRCWRGIEAAAEQGVPAMRRLRSLGVVEEVRAQYEWTARHRDAFERALH